MARRSTKEFRIITPAQVRAVVSPVRQEIVDALAAAGACTMSDLARHIGTPADRLYYHVRALVRAGLLTQTGEARTGTRFGAIYDVASRPMLMAYTTQNRTQVSRVVASALRLGQRDFDRALKTGIATSEPRSRNTWGGRVKGWLDPAQQAEVASLIERMVSLIGSGRPRDGATPVSFSYVCTPVVARRASRRPAKRPKFLSGVES